MRRDAQGVLLLALAAAVLKVSFSGVALRFVRPGMVPVLVATAVLLGALGAVTLWRILRAGVTPDLGSSGGRAGWLLLLPLIGLLVVVPPGLGATTGARYGTVLAQHAPTQFDPVPEGNPVRLTLVEYAARAVVEQGRSLSGRRIALSGFLLASDTGQPYLARLVIGCCAADARPVKVGLSGDVPADLSVGAWVEVEGSYTEQVDRDPLNGDLIPYLDVSDLRPIPTPAHPYES